MTWVYGFLFQRDFSDSYTWLSELCCGCPPGLRLPFYREGPRLLGHARYLSSGSFLGNHDSPPSWMVSSQRFEKIHRDIHQDTVLSAYHLPPTLPSSSPTSTAFSFFCFFLIVLAFHSCFFQSQETPPGPKSLPARAVKLCRFETSETGYLHLLQASNPSYGAR